MDQKPVLTEPGVKYFLNGVLKNCKEQRAYFMNSIFNISLFCLFILIIGSILYYKYRGKLTPEEKEKKKQLQKQHILSKLNQINVDLYKGSRNTKLITSLPGWDNSDVNINNPITYVNPMNEYSQENTNNSNYLHNYNANNNVSNYI